MPTGKSGDPLPVDFVSRRRGPSLTPPVPRPPSLVYRIVQSNNANTVYESSTRETKLSETAFLPC